MFGTPGILRLLVEIPNRKDLLAIPEPGKSTEKLPPLVMAALGGRIDIVDTIIKMREGT